MGKSLPFQNFLHTICHMKWNISKFLFKISQKGKYCARMNKNEENAEDMFDMER